MALNTAQLSLIEQRIANDGPSAGAAYLLWLLLWLVSGHRFYLGRPLSALLQIASYFILVGFVWLVIDGFLIPGMIRQKKDTLRQKMALNLLTRRDFIA
jgi:TM2 domain-containing membrane protein YozV